MNKNSITIAIVAVMAFAGLVWGGVGAYVHLDSNTGRTFPQQVNAGYLAYGGVDAGAIAILNSAQAIQGQVLAAGTGTVVSVGTSTANSATWKWLPDAGAPLPPGSNGQFLVNVATGTETSTTYEAQTISAVGMPPGYAGQVPVNATTGTGTSVTYVAQDMSTPGVLGTRGYIPMFTGTATGTSNTLGDSHLFQFTEEGAAGVSLYKAIRTPKLRLRSFFGSSTNPSEIEMTKSRTNTLDTYVTTQSGEPLGLWSMNGVNSSSGIAYGAYIQAVQDGTAGAAYVPAKLCMHTSSGSAMNTNQFCLRADNSAEFAGDLQLYQLSAPTLRMWDFNNAYAYPILEIGHSASSTLGTFQVTNPGDTLGAIKFAGVNTSSTPIEGASISAYQSAASGSGYVVSTICMNAASTSTPSAGQFCTSPGGCSCTGDISANNVTATPGNSKIPKAKSTGTDYLNAWISGATTGSDGLMSSVDKTKLDGLSAGVVGSGNVGYIPVFTGTGTGTSTTIANSAIKAADITATAGNSKVPISSSSGSSYLNSWVSNATTSVAGLMSTTDKTKLDAIPASTDVTGSGTVGKLAMFATGARTTITDSGINNTDFTSTPTASKIPIANANGKLDSWVSTGLSKFATASTDLTQEAPGFYLAVQTASITTTSACTFYVTGFISGGTDAPGVVKIYAANYYSGSDHTYGPLFARTHSPSDTYGAWLSLSFNGGVYLAAGTYVWRLYAGSASGGLLTINAASDAYDNASITVLVACE